ncbi:MAG TPA: hypothetical protein DGU45_02695 [Planctomycetes bacterium]|nr:hypothetical protein [Planctomycetota bacterium]
MTTVFFGTGTRMQDCPHCGAEVSEGRLACRECGSDLDTGWQDSTDIDYLSVDLGDDPVENTVVKKTFQKNIVILLILGFICIPILHQLGVRGWDLGNVILAVLLTSAVLTLKRSDEN